MNSYDRMDNFISSRNDDIHALAKELNYSYRGVTAGGFSIFLDQRDLTLSFKKKYKNREVNVVLNDDGRCMEISSFNFEPYDGEKIRPYIECGEWANVNRVFRNKRELLAGLKSALKAVDKEFEKG